MIEKHSAPWKTKYFRSYLCLFILSKHTCSLGLSSFSCLCHPPLLLAAFVPLSPSLSLKHRLCLFNSQSDYTIGFLVRKQPFRLMFERSLFTAVAFELSATLFPKTNDYKFKYFLIYLRQIAF